MIIIDSVSMTDGCSRNVNGTNGKCVVTVMKASGNGMNAREEKTNVTTIR